MKYNLFSVWLPCWIWFVKLFNKKLLFLIVFLSTIFLNTSAQEFLKNLSENNKKNYREELYFQTDRDLYIIGERVWFKIFMFNAYNKKPDNLSKVVYIELVNSSGFPVEQIKIHLQESSESGSFILSDTLSSGNYYIRAYTNWMKNFDSNDFAYKTISVINPFHLPGKIQIYPEESEIDTVLFFPEGGTLISGIKSKVGFYGIDKWGNLKKIKGVIINEMNDTLTNVRTKESGFGTFFINPRQPCDYRLLLNNKTGRTQVFPLGNVQKSGVSLSVTDSEQNMPFIVKINTSPDINLKGKNYFILVYSNGIISYVKNMDLTASDSISLDRNKLSTGLSLIILTDEKGKQLSSRWINNTSDIDIHFYIKTNKEFYGIREKVSVEIIAKDNEGNPVETDFSASIIKSFLINKNLSDITNINYHSLRSNYDSHANEHHDVNDELLFYTHGNSDFTGEDILFRKKIHYLPEMEGKIICGSIKNSTTEEVGKNMDVAFSLVGKVAKCQFYKTNDLGKFYFMLNETGLQEVIIQTLKTGLNNYYIELTPDFINTYIHHPLKPFYLDTSKLEELNHGIISMQVQSIYKSYLREKQDENINNNTIDFFGDPINSVRISEFIRLTTVREVIKEIVPHVLIRSKNGKLLLHLASNIIGQVFENDPLIIIDGTSFSNVDQILKMSSSKMERIDVLNLKYFIDGQVFDGIINFVTKKGRLEGLELNSSVFRQAYNGYHRKTKFNSPTYRNDSTRNSRIPDFRNTLYWNPNLHSKINDTLTFVFYTSDEPGSYTITIEGISPDGNMGTAKKEIIVN